jgi:hypothetical protein
LGLISSIILEIILGTRRISKIKTQKIKDLQNYFDYVCLESFSKAISLQIKFESIYDGKEIENYEITKR